MIKGNYSLTLTCSVCGKDDGGYKSLAVFDAPSRQECFSKAIEKGWAFNVDPDTDSETCPDCAKAKL